MPGIQKDGRSPQLEHQDIHRREPKDGKKGSQPSED